MNRGTVRDETRRLIRDTSSDTNKQRWSDAVLNARINEAHQNICVRTKCVRTRITTSIVAATVEYAMPANFIEEISVQILDSASDWLSLVKKTEQELDTIDRGWRDDTGDPASYYYRRREYIGLYPIPSVSRADALRVDYFRLPDDFTADADVPYEDTKEYYPFHRIIAIETARQCLMDRGGTEDLNLALTLRAEYEQAIREMIALGNSRSEQTRIINIYEQVRHRPRRTR